VKDANAFHLSQARDSDLPELSRLVNSSYRGESSRAGWTTEADYLDGQRTDPESLAQEVAGTDQTMLCLRDQEGGPILACVVLKRIADEQGVACYLGMLTVSPTHQAQGVGRILLMRAEEFARSWGAARITLGVIQLRESLIGWYERRGFRRTGQTKPFPYENPKAGKPRRDDLHFILFEKKISPTL
jgi:GNAT superfamily N-acetyltransferase